LITLIILFFIDALSLNLSPVVPPGPQWPNRERGECIDLEKLSFFQIVFYFQGEEGFGEAVFAGNFRRNHFFMDDGNFGFPSVKPFENRSGGFTELPFIRCPAGEMQFISTRRGLLQFILIDFFERTQVMVQFPGSYQTSRAGLKWHSRTGLRWLPGLSLVAATGTFFPFPPLAPGRRRRSAADDTTRCGKALPVFYQRRAAVFFFQRLEIHTAKLRVLVEFTGFALHEDITRFGGCRRNWRSER